jgi:hypothetical protein
MLPPWTRKLTNTSADTGAMAVFKCPGKRAASLQATSNLIGDTQQALASWR